MNNESVRWMMMAVTKRARVERAMVSAMRVAVDEEGKGNDEKDGIGDEGAARAMATRVTGIPPKH